MMNEFKKKIKDMDMDWFEFTYPFANRKEIYLSGKYHYKCLILGTFPSKASRDNGYFYGNKTNEFWEYLGYVFDADLIKMPKEQKEDWINNRGIAIYDIVESYEGFNWYSNDKDLFTCGKKHIYCLEFVENFLDQYKETKIMFTSRKAENKFKSEFKHCDYTSSQLFYLPSPSRLNRSMNSDEKRNQWRNAFKEAKLIQ